MARAFVIMFSVLVPLSGVGFKSERRPEGRKGFGLREGLSVPVCSKTLDKASDDVECVS